MTCFWLCRNCAGDFSISVHFLNAKHNSGRTIIAFLENTVQVSFFFLDLLAPPLRHSIE